ncbi:MAG: MAPEG family protein [Burkholderiales bacterium]|nr:MAPEG family protein [Burkholderiales bacterium]
MTIAFWCVLVAGLLPIVWAGAAKSRGDFDNRDPRAWLAALDGWRARANAAQANSWEAFAPFAAAVLIAHAAGAAGARVDALAVGFVLARVAYGLLYIADRPTLRTVAWTAGFACVMGLYAVAATAPAAP